MARIAALAAATFAIACPAPATAGTASATGGQVTFTDPVGAPDDLYVTIEQGTSWIVGFLQYNPPTTPGPGCVVGFVSVECDVGPSPPAAVAVDGGAGNDVLEVEGRPGPPGAVMVSGGAGDDQLVAYATRAELDGADGNDLIAPDERVALNEPPGPTPGTVVRGGAGTDTVAYASTISEIAVSLDGVANDGRPGEGDNILPDVESVSGSDYGNQIVGSPADNALEGGAGNDRLIALAGSDALTGLGGDDELNALDAEPGDRVDCSDGVDRVLLDAGDAIADDSCERSSWAPAVKTKKPRLRGGEIAISLACPKEAGGCRGALVLRSAKGTAKDVARGRYKVKSGKRSTARMRPTKAGRSALGGGEVDAELLVAPRGAQALAGRLVKVR